MTPVYSSGFQPNPLDTIDVLAFVLCSPNAFVPGGDKDPSLAGSTKPKNGFVAHDNYLPNSDPLSKTRNFEA